MPLELKHVHSLVELSNALLLGFKLADEQAPSLEEKVLCLILRGLRSFQSLEGDESEANQFLLISLSHQVKVVDLTKLRKVVSELTLQACSVAVRLEASEVEVVLGHRPLEPKSLQP